MPGYKANGTPKALQHSPAHKVGEDELLQAHNALATELHVLNTIHSTDSGLAFQITDFSVMPVIPQFCVFMREALQQTCAIDISLDLEPPCSHSMPTPRSLPCLVATHKPAQWKRK